MSAASVMRMTARSTISSYAGMHRGLFGEMSRSRGTLAPPFPNLASVRSPADWSPSGWRALQGHLYYRPPPIPDPKQAKPGSQGRPSCTPWPFAGPLFLLASSCSSASCFADACPPSPRALRALPFGPIRPGDPQAMQLGPARSITLLSTTCSSLFPLVHGRPARCAPRPSAVLGGMQFGMTI